MGRRGTRLHGRSREMSAAMTLLDRAAGDRSPPLLLVGEAGMGKTALLDEVARRARSRQVRTARAAAPDGGSANAFGIVEDLARCLPEHLERLPSDQASLLRRPPRDGSVGAATFAEALLMLLIEAARDQPVLVLVDDLQWADAGSLAAICVSVGRLDREGVAVVGAARPRPALDPRLHAWARIEVGPLEIDPATALLRSSLAEWAPRSRLDDRRAVQLAEALGRCPLAIVEAGRLLSPGQLAGHEPLPDPLPLDERLEEAWGRSWSSLPDPTRTALLALAVAQGGGRALTARLLTGLGVPLHALDPAESDGLLDRRSTPHEARLAHPLIRDAVMQAAGAAAVRAMHRRAADAAEDLGLPPSVVVAHLVAAAEPGDQAAQERLVAEAERAEDAGLGESAAHALLAAADLAPTTRERSRLAARAARTLMENSFDSVDVTQILAAADPRFLTPEERFWVGWLRSEWLFEESLQSAELSLEPTIERAAQIDSPMLPWIEFSVLTGAWGLLDGEASLRHARALRSLADRPNAGTDGRMPAWACRGMYALALFQVGQVEAAHDELETIRPLSRAWPPDDQATLVQRLQVAVVDAEMSQPDPWIDARIEDLAEKLVADPGQTFGFLRRLQAERAMRRGHLSLARALIDEARALGDGTASRVNLLVWLKVSVCIAAAQGDASLLSAHGAELRDLAARVGWPQIVTAADRAQGMAALGEGRLDDALTHLEPLAEAPLLGKGPWDAVPTGRADLVEALCRCGEADRAREVAAALAATLGPSGDPLAVGLVARVTGLVTQGEPAHAALRRAIAAFESGEEPFEAARTRLLLGEQLRRERRIPAARHELRLAAAAFEQMGAPAWEARAVGELRATRAIVTTAARELRTSLTPQERRVAEAVARGASDRQVAAELFLSPRTVAFHLSSVYRKLGVTGRNALTALLAQGSTPGSGGAAEAPRARRGQAGPG